MDNYAVQVENLTVAYDIRPVLWNINLSIPKSHLVAIIGPNGAGKTTLLKAMLGLLKPVSGKIIFENERSKKVSNQIAYVPQCGSVDWDFPATALDIVTMGRYAHLGWFKRVKKSDKELALEMLEKVGMQKYSTRQISELSGGEQQRVFLARALIQQADIYFLDEPFKGVDIKTEKIIISLLKELREQGKTVIVVHHDLHTVSDYFDWVVLINKQLIANGTLGEVFNHSNLNMTYGARDVIFKGAL